MILANTEAHLFQTATFLRINISSRSCGDPVYLKASRIMFTLSVFFRLEKFAPSDGRKTASYIPLWQSLFIFAWGYMSKNQSSWYTYIYIKKPYIRLFKAFKNKDKYIQRIFWKGSLRGWPSMKNSLKRILKIFYKY